MHSEFAVLHQTLHGYRDGHRLIESSIRISKESKRLMLILSDLSGPSVVQGFDHYLTGYPLPDEQFYAFACTWDAPEMQRPGCVWTHTLLLPMNILGQFHNLAKLTNLFVRPCQANANTRYGEAIETPSDSSFLTSPAPRQNEVAGMSLLFSLYRSEDNRPVVVAAHEAEEYEKLVLAVWAQQWPRLRRRFSFCTGSISSRSIDRRPLDLQIMPERQCRRYKKDKSDYTVAMTQSASNIPDWPEWVRTAWNDLTDSRCTELRSYLWDLGDGLQGGRRAYYTLVKLYTHAQGVNDGTEEVDDLVRALAEYYPQQAQGRYVKRRFLGPWHSDEGRLMSDVTEWSILYRMAITSYHTAFSAADLCIKNRALSLWADAPEQAQGLVLRLTRQELNPIGEELLQGIAQRLSPSDIVDLSQQRPGLLQIFVCRKPDLAACSRIWRAAGESRKELLGRLADCLSDLSSESQGKIVRAIVQAGADDIAEEAHGHFGSEMARAILEWSDETCQYPRRMSRQWTQVLRREAEACLSWLSNRQQVGIRTVALIATILPPCTQQTKSFGTDMWSRQVDRPEAWQSGQVRSNLASFLMPLGLSVGDTAASKLVAYSFEGVYNALENNQMAYQHWKPLDNLLPRLPWYRGGG